MTVREQNTSVLMSAKVMFRVFRVYTNVFIIVEEKLRDCCNSPQSFLVKVLTRAGQKYRLSD